MNYEPNTTDWKIGDLVLHDYDAKKKHMLAKIVEIKEDKKGKRFRMEYLDKKLNYQEWWNQKDVLHAPERFGIN